MEVSSYNLLHQNSYGLCPELPNVAEYDVF